MAPLERLRDLFRRDKAFVVENISDWFYSYHADLYRHGVPFEVYVEKVKAIRAALGGARRVLDVGAGFGVYAALLRIFGVAEVTALDYHARKALAVRKLMAYLGLDGVRVLHGDATVLPMRDGAHDGAIALASLSHIRDPQRALTRVGRALRPGGRLYVFEDNNSTFPGYRRGMEKVWEGAETGQYEGEVPHEKHIPESYLAMRREMIREKFPGLPAEAVEVCARATRGYYGRNIFDAVEAYRRSGRVTLAPREVARHPVSGEFEEYPLNPFSVSAMMRRAGFEPHLKSPLTGPFRGRRRVLKRLAAGILTAWPGLLPWTSPIFSVVGVRR